MTSLDVGLLLILGLAIGACSGAESIDEFRAENAKSTEAAQRAQLVAALEPLDPLRYHHLDRIVREELRIPADAVIWATRAREVLEWVDWPLELRDHVEQYSGWLDSLLAAFRNDDAHVAAEPSKIVHALAHTFEATLEAWLSSESLPALPQLAGLEPPMHDSGHGSHSDDAEHGEHGE